MMKKTILFCIALLQLSFLATYGQTIDQNVNINDSTNKKCEESYDLAEEFMNLSTYDSAYSHLIDTALKHINLAISCDSADAYIWLKVMILEHLEEDSLALETVNYLFQSYNEDFFLHLKKGNILQRLDKNHLAKQCYVTADSINDLKIKKYPDNTVLKQLKVHITRKLYGKEKALDLLKEYLVKHPNDYTLTEFMNNFDEYISQDDDGFHLKIQE